MNFRDAQDFAVTETKVFLSGLTDEDLRDDVFVKKCVLEIYKRSGLVPLTDYPSMGAGWLITSERVKRFMEKTLENEQANSLQL